MTRVPDRCDVGCKSAVDKATGVLPPLNPDYPHCGRPAVAQAHSSCPICAEHLQGWLSIRPDLRYVEVNILEEDPFP